jgi:RNA recognition motif-containing protein
MKRESKRQSHSYNIQNDTNSKTDRYEEGKLESLAPIQIFVGGINHRIDKGKVGSELASFSNYFQGFGAVNECRLVCDKVTKRSRGFGFVTYIDRAVAEKVLQKKHSINGSNVTSYKERLKSRTPSRRTSLTYRSTKRNLEKSLSEDYLKTSKSVSFPDNRGAHPIFQSIWRYHSLQSYQAARFHDLKRLWVCNFLDSGVRPHGHRKEG